MGMVQASGALGALGAAQNTKRGLKQQAAALTEQQAQGEVLVAMLAEMRAQTALLEKVYAATDYSARAVDPRNRS